MLDPVGALGDAQHQLEVLDAVEARSRARPTLSTSERRTHEQMADVHDAAEELGRPVGLEERLAAARRAGRSCPRRCRSRPCSGFSFSSRTHSSSASGSSSSSWSRKATNSPSAERERAVRRRRDAARSSPKTTSIAGLVGERAQVRRGSPRWSSRRRRGRAASAGRSGARTDSTARREPLGVGVEDGRDDRDERTARSWATVGRRGSRPRRRRRAGAGGARHARAPGAGDEGRRRRAPSAARRRASPPAAAPSDATRPSSITPVEVGLARRAARPRGGRARAGARRAPPRVAARGRPARRRAPASAAARPACGRERLPLGGRAPLARRRVPAGRRLTPQTCRRGAPGPASAIRLPSAAKKRDATRVRPGRGEEVQERGVDLGCRPRARRARARA